jgi:hypothetical protein
LYQENEAWRPKFDELPLDSIREVDRALLERKFEKEEIYMSFKRLMETKPPALTASPWLFFSNVGEW